MVPGDGQWRLRKDGGERLRSIPKDLPTWRLFFLLYLVFFIARKGILIRGETSRVFFNLMAFPKCVFHSKEGNFQVWKMSHDFFCDDNLLKALICWKGWWGITDTRPTGTKSTRWCLGFTPLKFNIARENLPDPKRKVVFQPSFFRAMLNFGGVGLGIPWNKGPD